MSYKEDALKARRKVLELVHKAGTSHIGSNFSVIDIATVLFSKINLTSELLPDRDRVIWSKGWAAATAYYFLAEKGVIPKEDLDTFCIGDSKYLGLVEPSVRGIEVAGGAMGHGLPIGLGMALGAKRAGDTFKTYVIMSDGEMNCGTTWESAMIAAHHKLNNLFVLVDVNGIQAMGDTKDVLSLGSLCDKWNSFGWNVLEVNGHNHKTLEFAIDTGSLASPTVILCNTTKGKGVSFMEDKLEWHYKNISAEDYQKALEELV